MRETLRGQEQTAEKADNMIDSLTLKMAKLKQMRAASLNKHAQSQPGYQQNKQSQPLGNISVKVKAAGGRNGGNGNATYRGQQQQKNSPNSMAQLHIASKQSQSSMNARLQEKKEDIDLLVFRDPAEEENSNKSNSICQHIKSSF